MAFHRIVIECDGKQMGYDCPQPLRNPTKTRTDQTIKGNDCKYYFCRACGLQHYYATHPDQDIRNTKISKSRKGCQVSDETKKRMSDAKKKLYDSPKGKLLKKVLSECTSKQIERGGHPLGHKSCGWHSSPKAGNVFYQSSYELVNCLNMDKDENVISYTTQICYELDGSNHNADCIAKMKNGDIWLIEIKPIDRIQEYKDQIDAAAKYSSEMGYKFFLWTEKDLGFKSYSDLRKWVDSYLLETTGVDNAKIKQEKAVERQKRYQEKHYDQLRTEFWCEFCEDNHIRLKWEYDKNVEKNGRYICIYENGQIVGSKSKYKPDPLLKEGKKQCRRCKEVKSLTEFSSDKSRSDGYNSRCGACNRILCNERYERRKKLKPK